jgi:hypothetical protein
MIKDAWKLTSPLWHRREVRKLFQKAILLGVHRKKAGVLAVPPDDLVLQTTDTLFGLAYNHAEFVLSRVRAVEHVPSAQLSATW